MDNRNGILGDQFRKLVEDSGIDLHEITTKANVPHQTLHNFMRRIQLGMNFTVASRIMDVVGLELRKKESKSS